MSNSHIQQAIISRLKNADVLRYSELKVTGIDRDLFNYHLRELVEKGTLTKLPGRGGYTLSSKGQRYVADAYHSSDQTNRLFKVNPVLIVIDKRPDGMYVVQQQRTSQPDYGTVGIPGGTITKSEPLLAGAARKLQEETGLTATFELIATTRRILYKNDKLFADVFFPICLATTWSGKIQTTEFGNNSWVHIDQAILQDTRIEYISTVLKAIKSNETSTIRGSYHEQIVSETSVG